MVHRRSDARPPLVLIIDDHEWSTRSLESILAPAGYAVMRAYTGAKGLERAQAEQPDLVVIDASLPDGDGLALCRALREDPTLRRTPIIVTAVEHPTRQQRLEAMRAGAWDFLAHPFDPEEMLLRLDAYVRAKVETDRLREECLLDEQTGLYNQRGIERRARELGSQAFRSHAPLACVVFVPDLPETNGEEMARAAVQQLARAFRNFGRISDAIGRWGKTEFVVVAPSTDSTGAVKLAERMGAAIRSMPATEGETGAPLQIRVGYDAVPNVREAPLGALDLLGHAVAALRKARGNGNGNWIAPYE